MKKTHARLLGLLALLTMLMLAMSISAAAVDTYDYDIRTIKPGRWTTIECGVMTEYNLTTGDAAWTDIYYKFTLKTDACLKLKIRVADDSGIGLYSAIGSDPLTEMQAGSYCWSLTKGTYYLRIQPLMGNGQAYLTYKNAVNKPNYCRSKAVKLNPGVTVGICETPASGYGRWYKISLKKARYLKVDARYYYGDHSGWSLDEVFVYDSRGAAVTMSNASGTLWYSSSKLSPGTYYIYVPRESSLYFPDMPSEKYRFSPYITIKWTAAVKAA